MTTPQPREFKGINGSLSFDGSVLTIARKGFGLRGTKTVPVQSIAGVQIRPAGLVNGFIQFSIAGEVSRSVGGAGQLHAAANDENSVFFRKKQNTDAEAFRLAVTLAQAGHAPGQIDIPTQLAKLAELRDSGALTEHEFTTKKLELLARL